MGFECVYEMPLSSSNLIISKEWVKISYIDPSYYLTFTIAEIHTSIFTALESRVELLEMMIARCVDRHDNATVDDYSTSPISPRSVYTSEHVAPPPGTVIVNVQNTEQDQPGDLSGTDGMAISLVDECDYGFFGTRKMRLLSWNNQLT